MDINHIRQDFPILHKRIYEKPLIYLDNAATTQKPHCVIDCMTDYYSQINANIHRGVHYLSEEATKAYETVRIQVQKFINARHAKECIFVKSTTEGVNLVATSFGEQFVEPDDEIVISALEHHSNIVPWQLLCERKGAKLKIIPINSKGEIPIEIVPHYFSSKTKLLAITHASNALGTITPLKEIIALAHQHNVPVLVDGAQSAPHIAIDVQDLACDFFIFSGHKIYGPTGVGVLYGKSQWLEAMPPYQGGGDMIKEVTYQKTTYQDLPFKFEAGTPPIAEVIGLGEALRYVEKIGLDFITAHEDRLLNMATSALSSFPGISIIGNSHHKIGVISFILEGVHPHDIGSILDQDGIAIRTGHHCAMPLMDFFKVPATARISFGIYNTQNEIDSLIIGLQKVKQLFKV